ncbi:VOC family protein [Sporosarcina sp. E16_3]|uniref:VOC family protein n=1 Tax=Sporosarcina sp. E16_3 TaxID=2789293 RepID=UPI001A92AC2A|nr:VOC family protein [Sporosarcina sp. E16_3]MBO0600498.1 VOC family protein [Sporosarcina sp. E16_3]
MIGNTNQQITTFLMFERKDEEAMNNYASVFADSKIGKMLHNPDGTVMPATFTFTPAI